MRTYGSSARKGTIVIHEALALPADRPTDSNWRARAACLSCPPDLFFPGDRSQVAIERMERAKAICRDCAVKGECLKFALDTFQEYGIWGGTDEKERQRIRRKQRLAEVVGSMPIGPRQLPSRG